MIAIDDSTPNKPGTDYVQLQSPEPDYTVACTAARKLRLPSRAAPGSDHHIDATMASAQAPLTIIGCTSTAPRYDVPLVGGPVTITAPEVVTFSCRPAASASGYEWVQA